MAQYFTDYSGTTVGQQPADTTLKRNAVSGNYTRQDDGGVAVLRFLHSGSVNARGLDYNPIDSSGVTEVFSILRDADASFPASARLVSFASDGPDNEYGCIASSSSSDVSVYKRVNGTFTLLGDAAFVFAATEYVKVLFRVTPGSPNRLQLRVWKEADPEPGTWLLDVTDSSLSLTVGWVGHIGFDNDSSVFFKKTGIGTDGDAAPTEALSTGATVNVGIASETSVAFPINRSKKKTTGLSTEINSALASTPGKVRSIGLITETDLALSVLRAKAKSVGLSTESDSAFALIIGSSVNVGLTNETDSSFPASRSKNRDIGLSSESDSSLSAGRSKIRVAGLGIETDVAFTISLSKLKQIGLVSELDQSLSVSTSGSLAVGLASEFDVALVIGRLKQQSLGQSSETDLSQSVVGSKSLQSGLSTESDAALSVTKISGQSIGLAIESDIAQSISRIKQRLVGIAPETDVALAVTISGVIVVINTSAKETLKLLAENPTLTLSAENATLTLS